MRAVVLLVALGTSVLAGARPAEASLAEVPRVGAAAVVLTDLADGRVLYEKNAHERRQVASTTKIVTALVVLAETSPDAEVVASAAAERVGADDPLVAEVELTAGERLPVRELLYALLLESANDAAVALAEHIAGSVGAFVEEMNATALGLGARDSHFANPHGLDDPDHYSSAFDLSLFAVAAMRHAFFREIVRTREHAIPRPNRGEPTVVRNRNLLLGAYPGATGVKTGQTRASGRSLVASARRGSEERISVVLASADPLADSATLLDYGFARFRRAQIADDQRPWGYATFADGTTWALVPVRDVSVLVPAGSPDPPARFEAASRRLRADVGGEEIAVDLRYECGAPRCQRPRTGGAGVAGLAWALLAPLARLLASLR